jgi:hypothetical protein
MQGQIVWDRNSVRLNIGFESFEDLKSFVAAMLVEPAKQFGYEVVLKKTGQKKGNVGVV